MTNSTWKALLTRRYLIGPNLRGLVLSSSSSIIKLFLLSSLSLFRCCRDRHTHRRPQPLGFLELQQHHLQSWGTGWPRSPLRQWYWCLLSSSGLISLLDPGLVSSPSSFAILRIQVPEKINSSILSHYLFCGILVLV